MRIYLIRHGEAITPGSFTDLPDDHIYLTPKGRKQTREVVKKIKEHLSTLDIIYSSPLVRAVQTTEVIAATLKFRKEIVIAEELSFSASLGKILHLLQRSRQYENIALVGHEPTMGMLTASLSGKQGLNFSFRKSGVACIDFDIETEKGEFKWYLNPKQLDLIT